MSRFSLPVSPFPDQEIGRFRERLGNERKKKKKVKRRIIDGARLSRRKLSGK